MASCRARGPNAAPSSNMKRSGFTLLAFSSAVSKAVASGEINKMAAITRIIARSAVFSRGGFSAGAI